jgi:hypothetical protein
MSMHPELNLQLAQTKIEEARSEAQHASAVRAASLDRQGSDVSGGTRRKRWTALFATVTARAQQSDQDATPHPDDERLTSGRRSRHRPVRSPSSGWQGRHKPPHSDVGSRGAGQRV